METAVTPLRDVVFIHKQNDWTGELPYALRSLANYPHRKVWFFGHKPDWVTNVEHVHVPDLPKKWDDIQNKYLAFLRFKGDMTDEVISMYDDVYFLDDRWAGQDLPTFHWGTTDSRARSGSVYRDTITGAGELLKQHGIARPLNYALHVPFVFIRSKAPTHWYKGGDPVQWRTMAGNTSGRPSVDLGGDVKVNRRTTLDEALSRDTGFLSTWNGNLVSSGARCLLRELFPSASPYEWGEQCPVCYEPRMVRFIRRRPTHPRLAILRCGHSEEVPMEVGTRSPPRRFKQHELDHA